MSTLLASHFTRLVYAVGRANELGCDPADGPYVTLCETHHAVLNSRTRQLARTAVHYPNWCDECAEILACREDDE